MTRQELADALAKAIVLVNAIKTVQSTSWDDQAFDGAMKAAMNDARDLAKRYASAPTLTDQ